MTGRSHELVVSDFAVTGVNLRSIPQRLGSSAVAVIGIAGVVLVFVGRALDRRRLPGDHEGHRRSADTVIVLRAGSDTEMTSGLSGDDARRDPGRARRSPRGRRRRPWPRPSSSSSSTSAQAVAAPTANVPLRGVTPAAFRSTTEREDHRRADVRAGQERDHRRPRRVAAVLGSRRRHDAARGARTRGRSSASSTTAEASSESEIWCDAKVLQPAYRRGNSFQSVIARLESRGLVSDVQGRADHEPAADRHRDARAGLLRAAVRRRCRRIIRTHRRRHRGADGRRRHLRRGQHDVHRRRQPHARDRDAARARLRQRAGRGLGAGRGAPASASSAA